MLEGKIIKFYRERQNMTQNELGNAICSSTHVSKIERGITEVSKETIQLLASRLGINLKTEIETYLNLENLLKKWHESIIMVHQLKAEKIKRELENIALLQMPDIFRFYKLILTRYYLLIKESHPVQTLIHELERCTELSPYETNMLLHIMGMDKLDKGEHNEAISLLQKINPGQYNNLEYYYHLAVAYHSLNSRVLAYHYASKSLQYFTESRNFTKIIDAEMLMLIQVEQDDYYKPNDSEYQRLIEMTENLNLNHHQAVLYHNYAYQQLRYGSTKKASEYYKKSMEARDPHTTYYLGSLVGYIQALTKEGNPTIEELHHLIEQGMAFAKEINHKTYIHFFQLHKLKLKNNIEDYYQYLEEEALPYFIKMGYAHVSEHYQVMLFDYYMEKGILKKANDYARSIISKYRSNHQFI